ncbi:MAG TPA: STAS domain-containing protein [Novosphingobium sp.]|nr:STAS domain-containing protein [Novosphingobium sp.]
MATKIELAERITMQSIADLHDALCNAFARPDPIEIDPARFIEGDLAVIQLIAAARAEATACNRSLSLCAPANPALRQLLERCGMTPDTPADADFWFHGVTRS